jgi:hypothetical protein
VVTADALTRWVAAYGLPDHRLPSPTEEPVPDTVWGAFLRSVVDQRLAGHLLAAIDAEALPVSEEQRSAAEDAHLRACCIALALDQRLLDTAELLDEAGLDFLVLKGTAHAHLAYPDPALRSYHDIDLLFPTERYEEALRVLHDAGHERRYAPVRPAFDRRFGKGATLLSPQGGELDIHRNLVFGTFGFTIDLGELFRSAVEFPLGERRLHALGAETRFLHACYHAALGDPVPRFNSVRDVAQMLCTDAFDADAVLDLARRWQATAVVARAVGLCRDHLGVDTTGPFATALADHEPAAYERRAIASYVGPNRHFATKVRASLPFIEGVGAKASFLRAAGLPSREFVQERGSGSGLSWMRRGVRSLTWREDR